MRKKFIALFVMLVMTSVSYAQENRAGYFTGSELVAALSGKMPSEVKDPEMRRLFAASYGKAYILGVADQTQGSLWCSTHAGILPHELKDRVYTYLLDLPQSHLSGNAGQLVAEALQNVFPCNKGGSSN